MYIFNYEWVILMKCTITSDPRIMRHRRIYWKLYVCYLYLSIVLIQCNSQRKRFKRRRQIPCSKFEFTGYQCVSKDACGNDGYTIDDLVDKAEIRTNVGQLRNNFNLDFVSAKYSCPNSESDICCRKSSFYGIPEPVIKDIVEYELFCDTYSSNGYHCVPDDQCGSDGYTVDNGINGDITIRDLPTKEDNFASKLSCDVVSSIGRVSSSLLTCCRNSSFYGVADPLEVASLSNECNKWRSDGFKCVEADACEDGYFDSSGSVPAVREDFGNVMDIDEQLASECSETGFVCCRNNRFYNKPLTNNKVETPNKTPFQPECGRRNDIKGMSEASEDNTQSTWPHMCTIWKATSAGDKIKKEYVCGASLISQDMVLTTEHNIAEIPTDNLLVRCGEGDTVVEGQHQDRWALEKVTHEDYKLTSQSIPEYDLAVIKVESNFKLSTNVDTICLPTSHDDYDANDCYATGFGQDVYDPINRCRKNDNRCKKRLLKKIPMPVIDQKLCQNRLRKAKRPGDTNPLLGSQFKLHDSFICAGGNINQDTCTGDGGSPLVCARKGNGGKNKRYVQVGIVSWGIGCSNGNPGVYTNVIAGLEFIENQLAIR